MVLIEVDEEMRQIGERWPSTSKRLIEEVGGKYLVFRDQG